MKSTTQKKRKTSEERRHKSEDTKYTSHKRYYLRSYEKEEINKKIKSEESKKNAIKFLVDKISNYEDIFKCKWNKKIKNIQINENGEVTKKLNKEELILNNCKEIAIDNLRKLKSPKNLDDILNILSYDNTNPSLLYFCSKIIKENKLVPLFEEWIKQYKYCLCNLNEITDYFNNDKKSIHDLNKEFGFKFPFSDVEEGINTLKNTLDSLVKFARNYNFIKSEEIVDEIIDKKNIIPFKYKYDKINHVFENEHKDDDLYTLGFNWLNNYLKVKDFDYSEKNQPVAYENNKILYLSFCIYEIFAPLINIEEENGKMEIEINQEFLVLVSQLSELLLSLKEHLDNNNIDKEFTYNMRYFNIIFFTKNPKLSGKKDCEKRLNYMNHIFKEKIDLNIKEKLIQEKIRNTEKKDASSWEKIRYEYSKSILSIKKSAGNINFNIKDYELDYLILMLSNTINNLSLEDIWEHNSLDSFQKYNFLTENDIKFLKNVVRDIFKTKFWKDICDRHCDNDFIPSDIFKSDDFINQYFDRIIFLPFNINDTKLFAYTTAEDLHTYISGYPYMPRNSSLSYYKANRIFQLGISVIVILHESIHFLKRLLYLLTCQMISRITINDNQRIEGDLFEEIVFGWKTDENDKTNKVGKIDIDTAFDLLNLKTYENGLDFTKEILSKKRKITEKSYSLKEYLLSLGISDEKKFKTFKNKYTETVNAQKKLFEENYVIYYNSGHSQLRPWAN